MKKQSKTPGSKLDSKSALEVQVGGDHYKHGAIQPVEFLEANPTIPFTLATAIKYLARIGKKGSTPAEKKRNATIDLAKVRHYLELYEQLEELRK